MLRSLHIENIAVISRVDLELSEGFSVLTGETGAGKSIILDSLNLLLGNRVPKDLIRTGETRASVSALFEELSPAVCQRLVEMGFSCEDGTLMLQRELSTDGRSRTRINGQAVTQGVQRAVAQMLISIHGQADSQRLLQKSTHRELLDAYGHPDAEKEAYAKAYAEWRAAEKRLLEVSGDESEKLRRREMLQFQIADIDSHKLKEGEEELLEKERDRLLYAERINKQATLIHRALRGAEKGSARDLLARSESALHSLSGLVEDADALALRLAAARSEIEDVAELVLGYLEEDTSDPTARIDRIEGRLESISKLKRKYGSSIAEILAFRDRAQTELDSLELSDEMREALERETARLLAKAKERAEALSARRRSAAEQICSGVSEALRFLDMPKVRFAVRVEPAELSEQGADDVEFLFSANPGEPLLPMIRIASGGELSRMMLALRSVINDRDGAETIVFDEIDTGVSGKTSRKIGIKLKASAKGAQVLCVTHSAQIASLADSHFRISKEEKDGRAHTRVTRLVGEECVEELARILGGIEVTEAQRQAARDMMTESN
ncbi:MAG: DNA repair protein RecN [Clostridia bacterium]|nr:DNA repair protein RecN [Clostridia bacterium]